MTQIESERPVYILRSNNILSNVYIQLCAIVLLQIKSNLKFAKKKKKNKKIDFESPASRFVEFSHAHDLNKHLIFLACRNSAGYALDAKLLTKPKDCGGWRKWRRENLPNVSQSRFSFLSENSLCTLLLLLLSLSPLLLLLLFSRPGFLDEHAESVDVATSKTDKVSRIDRRQSVAGSCGTIDRIGAREKREAGVEVAVYREIARGLVWGLGCGGEGGEREREREQGGGD